MTASPWQRRVERAEELAARHAFAAEILGFYASLARFQEDLYRRLCAALPHETSSGMPHDGLGEAALSALGAGFESYLLLAEERGPEQLAKLGHELRARGALYWSKVLQAAWTSHGSPDPQTILALAFLQPYAELLRSRTALPSVVGTPVCPFCSRKPVVGVLRPKSEGAARFLICSFCLNEWESRRLVCPACGEENDRKLTVYAANSCDYIRLDCCETCKTYIKAVDLTKNGLADPIVDELASVPMDIWARKQGYAKLQTNVLGL